MLHKAWNSKGEMPYRFSRSSVKFQGHTVQNITDFDPNWAFPDYRPVAAFKSLRFALFLHILYLWYSGIAFFMIYLLKLIGEDFKQAKWYKICDILSYLQILQPWCINYTAV